MSYDRKTRLGHHRPRSRHHWSARRARGPAQRRQRAGHGHHGPRSSQGETPAGAAIRPPRRLRLSRAGHAAGRVPDSRRVGEAARRALPAVPHVLTLFRARGRRRSTPAARAKAHARPDAVLVDGRQGGVDQSRVLDRLDPGGGGDVPEAVGRRDRRDSGHRRDAAGGRTVARPGPALSGARGRRLHHHRVGGLQAGHGVSARRALHRVRDPAMALVAAHHRDLRHGVHLRADAGTGGGRSDGGARTGTRRRPRPRRTGEVGQHALAAPSAARQESASSPASPTPACRPPSRAGRSSAVRARRCSRRCWRSSARRSR